jgi:hypothetical protein
VSLRGPLLAFVLPAALGRLFAVVERLPVWVSLAAKAAAIGAWHVPAAYAAYPSAADQQLAGLVMMVEQTVALGLFAGVVLRSAFAPTPSRRRPGRLGATA